MQSSAPRVEFMVAVEPGLGLLIRYACISILKHDEWSRHGDFGGERKREWEREAATMKIVPSWRLSTMCYPENRSPPDGLLRLPDKARRLNLNIESYSLIQSSRCANFQRDAWSRWKFNWYVFKLLVSACLLKCSSVNSDIMLIRMCEFIARKFYLIHARNSHLRRKEA